MGIDLATWRARIGLSYYHRCRPLQTRWRSSGGRVYQPGVASWGVGEVMNDIPLVLKDCMTIVALSLILQYVIHSWSKLKGRGGGVKVCCYWRESTSQVRGTTLVDGGRILLLRAIVVVIPLLLVIAGDVETNPGPEEPSLKALLNELHLVRASWYKIGVQLDIPHTELDCFEQKYSDPSDLICEVLKHWLKTSVDPPPSWEAVITALRSPIVNEKTVAAQLESKYCAQVQCMTDESSSPSKAEKSEVDQTTARCIEAQSKAQMRQPHSSFLTSSEKPATSSAGSSNSKVSQKSPFGCGCGKCTFFSFIESGCPSPIPSASSFPYLDLSGLTHEQQQELRGRLRSESQEIMIRFQELVSATIESLIQQSVSKHKLVSQVMTLGAFDPVLKEPQVPVLCHHLKELKAASTIYEMFLVLNDYFSFFNYQLIEHIIKALGTKEDGNRLQRYKEEFDQYAKRRIFECLPKFGPVSDADHADLFVKLDSQYDNYTVAEIEEFRRKLSKLLRVSHQGIMRLCRVDKGCVQLTFQVPLFVQLKIFPLSREQEESLAAMGVIRLTCGEYQFLKDEPSHVEVDIKYHQDPDDDSGVGPSISTDTKSTVFSENHLDKKLKELDYELRVQNLVETASSCTSGSDLELHYATVMGRLEDIKYLIEKKHCNPMQKNEDGFTPFHLAALEGSLEAFKYFIVESNCNPACPGPLGLTPLHLACERGHLDVVKYLVIEQQIDPLCEDQHRNTPLHRACARGHQAVVKFLTSELTKYTPTTDLLSGLKNKWSSTPLHAAVANGRLDILKFFISDQNSDPNIPGQFGATPLHHAAGFGHLHIVKYLTNEQGCNPSCPDEYNATPLHLAAMNGHMDIVKFLTVEKHCKSCTDSEYQQTPLHAAALDGHIDIVKFLTQDMHWNTTSRNVNNDTALHLAVMKGNLDIVQFFISDLNCDPNIPGHNGKASLHYAVGCGHLNIVKYLIDEPRCNPSCLDDMKSTPLHYAALKGDLTIVKFLTMEKHCDSMSTNIHGNNAFHIAVQFGHLEIVKFFVEVLKCSPDILGQLNLTPLEMAEAHNHPAVAHYLQNNSVIPYIHTAIAVVIQLKYMYITYKKSCNPFLNIMHKYFPLHLAALDGRMDIVKFLTVEKHRDPMCREPGYQRTPLHMAALGGHISIIKFLILEMHCEPTSRDANNDTALHLAAVKGHLDIVQFFISDQKCNPKILGLNCATPLHRAAEYGHLHVVKYLTDEQGCNLSCLDSMKQTPLHYAVKRGHQDIVKFLTVKKHLNPMSQDNFGRNILYHAVMAGHLEIVKFLIEKLKCPPNIPAPPNTTPQQMAVYMNRFDIAQYLQKHSVINATIAVMEELGFLN